MSPETVSVSIGIMAHNEAGGIAQALRSLFCQDLLRLPALQVELVVLANGCSDNTVQIAKQTLLAVLMESTGEALGKERGEASPDATDINLSWSVEEIAQPGKSNAWNLFVHRFSSRTADYLFLMDADIDLLGTGTLQAMVAAFEAYPQAHVIVDRPIKDIALKPHRSGREKLSVMLSGLSGGGAVNAGEPAWLCGQLYCARATALRKIRLPISSLGEDNLLYRLIVSNNLASKNNPHLIVLADAASHSFAAYTQLGALLRHERLLIASNSMHDLLMTQLRQKQLFGPALNAYIDCQNQENPRWISDMVHAESQRRRWLIPRFVLTRRFVSLAQKPIHIAIGFLPLAIAAFVVDLSLALRVNRDLHRGTAFEYWA